MKVIALVLLALFATGAFAQTPDTTAAWRYYPLQIGNVWEYNGSGSPVRKAIVADTLVDGRHWYLERHTDFTFSPPASKQHLIRFDTLTATVRYRMDGQEMAVPPGCPLDAPFGGQVECGNRSVAVSGGPGSSIMIGSAAVSDVMLKTFDDGMYRHRFVAGIGFVERQQYVPESGLYRLFYARVGGVEYGSPIFPVANEVSARGAAPALSVHPNPAADQAHVALTLTHPQRVRVDVIDVLGRVRRSEHLDLPAGTRTHALDVSLLPAGAYVVRVTGRTGFTATARLVKGR
jgi:hypothetical protein